MPARTLLAQVMPLMARSKPLSLSGQQSPRLVTSTLAICSGCAIDTLTAHHGSAWPMLVCVQLPEPQMGLALPSMARSAPPELDVELCVADAPAIETLCAEGGSCGGSGGGGCDGGGESAHGQKRWHRANLSVTEHSKTALLAGPKQALSWPGQ